MRIEGASALVVGGASGLGAATARRLHRSGAQVVIADLNPEKGEALAAELGTRASFVEANVHGARAGPGGRRGGQKTRREACGSRSAVPASAGPSARTGKQGPHDLEIFHNVVKVNLIGTFNVLRLAAAAMVDNAPDQGGERGVCINTASVAAFDGQSARSPTRPRRAASWAHPAAARDLAAGGAGGAIAPGRSTAAACRATRGASAAPRPHPVPQRLGQPEEFAAPDRRNGQEPHAQRRDDPASTAPCECPRGSGGVRLIPRIRVVERENAGR